MAPEDLARWIESYERAWRTAGTEVLASVFAAEATYSPGPYEDTLVGLSAIATFWEAGRDGPDERFTLNWSPVVIGDWTAVARVQVDYTSPRARQYRDLWIVTIDDAGRAVAFEEWPFHAGQPVVAQ